ncbi:MAG: glutathione ABC transporter substrate-binding protein, partial [Peptostreptococcaceae bacterium]|nr:glutathione ABC transporter substrate-binding protein [Peptostreptococcaceae bacterium]
TGDPDYGLFPLFHSSTFGDAGNRTFYTTPKVDELLEKGRFSVDPKEREAAYMEVQQIVRDDAPWVFMNYGENISGTSSKVKGFKQHPAGHYRLYPVYFE